MFVIDEFAFKGFLNVNFYEAPNSMGVKTGWISVISDTSNTLFSFILKNSSCNYQKRNNPLWIMSILSFYTCYRTNSRNSKFDTWNSYLFIPGYSTANELFLVGIICFCPSQFLLTVTFGPCTGHVFKGKEYITIICFLQRKLKFRFLLLPYYLSNISINDLMICKENNIISTINSKKIDLLF